MLNSKGHEHIPFCVCDPDKKDCPIVFSSDGFCEFTGYSHGEIEGRNCRFLQGKDTKKEDVDRIRTAIKDQVPTSVNLLNYRKDGSPFVNEFFLAPLRDSQKNLVYDSFSILAFNVPWKSLDQDKRLQTLGGSTRKEAMNNPFSCTLSIGRIQCKSENLTLARASCYFRRYTYYLFVQMTISPCPMRHGPEALIQSKHQRQDTSSIIKN